MLPPLLLLLLLLLLLPLRYAESRTSLVSGVAFMAP
jgi:hypothetical protein